MLATSLFIKPKFHIVVLSDSSHRAMVDFICFMGGGTPDKREPQSCVLAKSRVIQRNYFTVVLSESSNCGMMDFICFMGGDPLINGNHKVVCPQSHFSCSEIFLQQYCHMVAIAEWWFSFVL